MMCHPVAMAAPASRPMQSAWIDPMRPLAHCQLVNGVFGDPVVYADVMFERRALLFDLGDITALVPRKLLRVSHVFVTHAHMDHFSGFDHLLRLLLGRERTVTLYGPAGFIGKVEHKLHAYTWNVIGRYTGNLVVEASEVHEDGTVRRARFQSASAFRREMIPDARLEGDVLASCGTLIVRCAVLDHGTPCLGFALEEPAHVNVWKTRLDELGLEARSWLRDLKRAILDDKPATTPICAVRRSEQGATQVTLPLGSLREIVHVVPGQKIGYVMDVRSTPGNDERIGRLVSHADLLFIECTFLDADAAHAARKNHLTARQAGILARRAQVRRLVPCHFSSRYTGRGEELSGEAQSAFRQPRREAEDATRI